MSDVPLQMADLEPTLTRITELQSSPDERRISKQHLVSKVLLKLFAHRDKGAMNVRVVNLAYGTSVRKKPAAVGYVKDFVRFRSEAAEVIWAKTEDRLPAALKAVDNRTIVAHPDLVTTLIAAIVLHYFRAEQTKRTHEQVWAESIATMKAELLTHPDRLRQLCRQKYGFAWDDEADLSHIVNDLVSGAVELHDTEVLFQARLEDLFRKGQERIATSQLEITESINAEFLLGDSPAVAFREGQLWPRTALLDAGTVALPLSRTKVASLGRVQVWHRVAPTVAERLNLIEVQQANRHVFFHPLSALDNFVRKARPPTQSWCSSKN